MQTPWSDFKGPQGLPFLPAPPGNLLLLGPSVTKLRPPRPSHSTTEWSSLLCQGPLSHFIFIDHTLIFFPCQPTAEMALPLGPLPDPTVGPIPYYTLSGQPHTPPLEFTCTHMTTCLMAPLPAKLKVPAD